MLLYSFIPLKSRSQCFCCGSCRYRHSVFLWQKLITDGTGYEKLFPGTEKCQIVFWIFWPLLVLLFWPKLLEKVDFEVFYEVSILSSLCRKCGFPTENRSLRNFSESTMYFFWWNHRFACVLKLTVASGLPACDASCRSEALIMFFWRYWFCGIGNPFSVVHLIK